MEVAGREASQQLGEFTELPGRFICQLSRLHYIIGMGSFYKGDQPEIALCFIMYEVPPVQRIQGPDKQVIRVMSVKVVPKGVDIFRYQVRFSENILVDLLQYIIITVVGYFPRMIDKTGPESFDGTFIFMQAISR